jgi:pyridoxine kinase
MEIRLWSHFILFIFMNSILSIQSHVAYGYVGNKAAVYPLQYMGYDVWPVNTVQFSNHTGYGKWQGEIFTAEHIKNVVKGIEDIGQAHKCKAILSGYMGSKEICEAVAVIAQHFKAINQDVLYLCDPVIGNNNCFVKPEVLDFFKERLMADIITPNQYEAEILSKIKITDISSLKNIAKYFHDRGIKIVIITGLNLSDVNNKLCVFISDVKTQYLLPTPEYHFSTPVNGTGDLFSSLYLGHYLQTQNVGLALQYTVYHLQKVLENTYELKERELQVLSVRYDRPKIETLLPLITIY